MLKTLKKIIKRLSNIKTAPFLIESTRNITVGKMSYHNGNFILQGSQIVKIGSYCAFGENVSIITENHDYNYPVMQYTFYRHYFGKEHPGVLHFPPNKERTKGGVEIGNDVWIGHNTTILSGVKIGNGAILGNGCIVTKDVEPYSIVSGIPARKIKMRFKEEIVKYLQEIKWWNWSEDKIKMNAKFFYQNQNISSLEEIKILIIE
jgi:acetyltransferase-like isoleucine patch superfamily enzyme